LSHKTNQKNLNRVAAQYPVEAAHRTKKICTHTGQFNIKDEKESRAEEKEN